MTRGRRSIVEATPAILPGRDLLTRLPNRDAFFSKLNLTIAEAQRRMETFSILAVDIDKFSLVNNSYGSDVGDHLLMIIAARLAESVSEFDTIARNAGDSFVIILRNLAGRAAASTVARRVLKKVAAPVRFQDLQLQVTASIGLTMFPADSRELDVLMVNSELALSDAKRRGGATHAFFNAENSRQARQSVTVSSALREAVDRGELDVHYQPIIDGKTLRIASAEALVRWNSPTLGNVPPSTFIPLAEDMNIISPIGEWVLERACRDAAAWQAHSDFPVSVAVNLSARQARGDLAGLSRRIERSLEVSRLPPALLKFELTESCLFENRESLATWANWLRDRQISLSIDDFGTGYSNLQYLRDLPLEIVKIDRSFVSGVSSPQGADLVKALINMLHSLGKKVVAEGVEDIAQLNFLREHGCDLLQGYLFKKPIPSGEFASLLRTFDASACAA